MNLIPIDIIELKLHAEKLFGQITSRIHQEETLVNLKVIYNKKVPINQLSEDNSSDISNNLSLQQDVLENPNPEHVSIIQNIAGTILDQMTDLNLIRTPITSYIDRLENFTNSQYDFIDSRIRHLYQVTTTRASAVNENLSEEVDKTHLKLHEVLSRFDQYEFGYW